MKDSKILKGFFVILFSVSLVIFFVSIALMDKDGNIYDVLARKSYESTYSFWEQLISDTQSLEACITFQDKYTDDGKIRYDYEIIPNVTIKDALGSIDKQDVEAAFNEIYVSPDKEKKEVDGYQLDENELDKLLTFYSDYANYVQSIGTLEKENSNFRYYISWTDNKGKEHIFDNEEYTKIEKLKVKIKWSKDSDKLVEPKIENEMKQNVYSSSYEFNTLVDQYKMKTYKMIIGVDTEYKASDLYATEAKTYEQGKNLYLKLFYGSLAAWVFSLIILMFSAGNKKGEKGISLIWFDKWFTEIGFVCSIVMILLPCFCIWSLGIGGFEGYTSLKQNIKNWNYISFDEKLIMIFMLFISIEAALFSFLSLVRRIKAGTLFSNSLVIFVGKNVREAVKNPTGKFKISIYILGIVIFYLGVNFIWFCITMRPGNSCSGYAKLFILGEVLIQLIAISFILSFFNGYEKVYYGIHKIASGDVDYKIDVKAVPLLNKEIAKEVNKLSDGLGEAVNSSVKNERLKSDLITNVSHDIKTPLTSIINYVGLLKMENIDNEKAQGYIRVLEEKSNRLKSLTEDLVEASKLSSGVIKLNKTKLNLKELIYQAIGEFEEKFETKKLKLICNMTSEEANMSGDGRRVWRILENVFGNAYKYSLEGTRIYVDLLVNQEKIFLSVKNVSANALNFDASELTERFIRGDVARNTEGSGLGLSIVRSLVELHGGTLNLVLDGDLFKVVIEFQRIN